jgi:protein-L-isoaspartate(D-aspartate) O-methyltransferase
MAWRSSGGSHRELIENLFKNGLIKDQRIKQAMLSVDRADFTDQKSDAYDDRPQSSKFIENLIFIDFFFVSWICGK